MRTAYLRQPKARYTRNLSANELSRSFLCHGYYT
jgi:hypothetical protein